MKVLMINVVCGIRSTGRICTDLATALEAQGHEVKIAYGRESVPEQYQKFAVRIGTDIDVKLHALKARLFDACGWGSKRATEKLIEWVKEFDPDVIHLHNLHGYYINIEVLFEYLRVCKKQIVWSFYDCWAFTGHCAHYDFHGCMKWKDGCYSCKFSSEYPRAIVANAKRNYWQKKELFSSIPNMQITVPSLWMRNQVEVSFLKQYPISLLPNGIDVYRIHRQDNKLREKLSLSDKFVILGVSTFWNVVVKDITLPGVYIGCPATLLEQRQGVS